MKCFLLVILFSVFRNIYSQTTSSVIHFTEKVYDFGTIKESNGKISHQFVFENKGKEPVVITNVNGGCGCITNKYTKYPIKSGQKGYVNVTFSPDYKEGLFSKEIVVFSNSGTNYNRIWITGTIQPKIKSIEENYPYSFGDGLYMSHDIVVFIVPKKKRQSIEILYTNQSNKTMILNFVVDENYPIEFHTPITIPPKGEGKTTFSYTPLIKKEGECKIYPMIDQKKSKTPIIVRIYQPTK